MRIGNREILDDLNLDRLKATIFTVVMINAMFIGMIGTSYMKNVENAAADQGGPDAWGYIWTNNTGSPSVTYNWIEINQTGTDIGYLSDDSETGPFPIGFTFEFYGSSKTEFYIGNNGGIGFSFPFDLPTWGRSIPNEADPNDIIVPFWDDLDSETGAIYYQTLGIAPNRYLVVQWDERCHFSGFPGKENITFELILYESTNIIRFQYQDVYFADIQLDFGRSATVGIENSDGTIGLGYLHEGSPHELFNDSAIEFEYIPPPYRVDLKPNFQTNYSYAGGEADFVINITNTGANHDIYDLTADYMWPVTFLDLGYSPITNIFVASGTSADFIARVNIPGASPGDFDIANITATSQTDPLVNDTVQIQTQVPYNANWLDDFELGWDAWTTEIIRRGSNPTYWEVGDPSGTGPSTAFSGINCSGTNLIDIYYPYADICLVSPYIELGIGIQTLGFYHWYQMNTNTNDGGFIEISVDGAPWIQIYPVDGYDDNCYMGGYNMEAYTSSNGYWEYEEFDLSAYATQVVQVRFHLAASPWWYTQYGWYVDDVYLGSPPQYRCKLTPDFPVDYGYQLDNISYILTLNNSGVNDDTYDLTSMNTWPMTILDLGLNPITSIFVPAWSSVDFIVNVSIPGGASAGEFDLANITATSQNDPWVNDTVQIRTQIPYNANWFDDFEIGWDAWTTEIIKPTRPNLTLWEIGDPSGTGPDTAHSGGNCSGTNIVEYYYPNADICLVSPYVELSSGSQILGFYHWYEMFTYQNDGGIVEISVENGPWTKITPLDGYDSWVNMGGYNTWGYTGINGMWEYEEFDLSFYATQVVRVRFHFGATPWYNGHWGWYVDDVYLGSLPSYRCEFNPDFQFGYGDSDNYAHQTVNIENTGAIDDTYDLTQESGSWLVTFLDLSFNPISQITVASGNSVSFIANVSIPGVSPGNFDLAEIRATSQNDSLVNDTAEIFTQVPMSPPYIDYFEGTGPMYWADDDNLNNGTQWEWGDPITYGAGPNGAYSLPNCWGTNLLSEYQWGADAFLYMPFMDLTSVSLVNLSFWHWYNIDSNWNDGGLLEISTDSGQSWIQLYPEGGYPMQTNGYFPGGSVPCYAENSGGWIPAEFNLSSYSGDVVLIRFRFWSEPWPQSGYPGWYIDDVRVLEIIPGATTATATGPTGGPTANPSITIEYDVIGSPGSVELWFTTDTSTPYTWNYIDTDSPADGSYDWIITAGDGWYGWFAVSPDESSPGIMDAPEAGPYIYDISPPIANAGSDDTVDEDIPYPFDGTGSSDNEGIIWYNWSFGDGNYNNGSDPTPSHSYFIPGIYVVTLEVMDAAGNWASDTITITVNDVTAPVADAGSDGAVNEGSPYNFDGSGSYDPEGGTIVWFNWTFGDGFTDFGSDPTPTHSYSNPGMYVVTLMVTDSAGNSDTDTLTVTVNDITPPTIISTVPPDEAPSVGTAADMYVIEFSEPMDTGSTPFTDLPSVSWVWAPSGLWLNGTYTALNPGQTYYVNLTGQGFQDPAGNPLTGDMDKNFTTALGPWATVTGPTSLLTNNATPILEYDYGSTPINVEIYWSDNGGATWNSWGTDSSIEGTWTPGTDLPTSGTYYWCARALNGIDEPAPSGPADIESGPYVLDIDAPSITTTTPIDDATGISTAGNVYVIEFSEPMANVGIPDTTFPGGIVWNWDSGLWLNGTYGALNPGQIYYVNLTGQGFQDLAGNALTGDMDKNFTTMVAPSTATGTGPIGGPTNDASITIEYDVTNSPVSVDLWFTTDTSPPYTWTYIGTDSPADGTYDWTITTGDGSYGWFANTTDEAAPTTMDVPEASPYIFDGTAPEVDSTNPLNGAPEVPVDQNVVITFNEAINTSTFTYTFESDPGGLSEAWSSGDSTLTISHTDFALATRYWVNVTVSQDLAGNDLNPLPYSFYFDTQTTGPLPDTEPPNSSIGSISQYQNTLTFNIPWTASDPSDIKHVELYYTTDGGSTWNKYGGTFTSSPISFTASSDGEYGFYLIATDNSPNENSEPEPPGGTTPEVTTSVDDTDPTVNAGLDVNAKAVFTQTGTASDAGSDINTYSWTKVSGPGSITFGSADALSTTVSASKDGTYVIKLTVTDNAGNSASDEFTLAWDATPPSITSGTPTGTDVIVTTTIKITFSEPVNKTQAENAFSITPSVAGTFSWNTAGTVLTFTPTSPLAYGTEYNVTLDASGIVDGLGNHMLNKYYLTFTTEAAPPQETGDIKGQVVDEDGNPIKGATVTLEGTSLSTTTDENGNYSFTDVPVGTYTLNVEKDGYETEEKSATVTADQTTNVAPTTLSASEEKEPDMGWLPIILVLIIIIIIIVALMFLIMRKKKEPEGFEDLGGREPQPPPPPVEPPMEPPIEPPMEPPIDSTISEPPFEEGTPPPPQ